MLIHILRDLLQQIVNDMDSGNTNMSEKELLEAIEFLERLNSPELSKTESADYIGVSRATFDNYINKGLIPKGRKRLGFKELSWNKSDLDKYINYANNIK